MIRLFSNNVYTQLLAAGYDVTFPYYLTIPAGEDFDWMSEPAMVTIHVTPTETASLTIEKTEGHPVAPES